MKKQKNVLGEDLETCSIEPMTGWFRDGCRTNKNDKRFFFSQLLGMSDHISYNLSENGYNVAKYVPYGPVKDVLPYLIRRAEENSSVDSNSKRELELINE